jgi:hypothetical protein
MKRNGLVLVALIVGFVLGNVVPGLVKAAPRVGDLKFENQFIRPRPRSRSRCGSPPAANTR